VKGGPRALKPNPGTSVSYLPLCANRAAALANTLSARRGWGDIGGWCSHTGLAFEVPQAPRYAMSGATTSMRRFSILVAR
jgi:hypothetical protein